MTSTTWKFKCKSELTKKFFSDTIFLDAALFLPQHIFERKKDMVTDNLLDGSYYDSDKYESLSEKAKEIRRFFVPCVISAFLEVLSKVIY